ncbi:hypothetical protein BJ742DRAFT_828349 [Cladochytrium replicatum]|nr:hypothetical protein BJ742DRAFT_828349 [Cladochytrium replicatum]
MKRNALLLNLNSYTQNQRPTSMMEPRRPRVPFRRPLAQVPKFNSCSTLFADSTLTCTDLQQTLKCVALSLASTIRSSEESGDFRTSDILSERVHPLSSQVQFCNKMPTDDDIFRFLECLFQAAELTVECAIISLIYVERMMIGAGISLCTSNWARALLGGLLLASKVWDDHAVWNADFCQIFPDVQLKDMNELERFYMSAINFNVSIKASIYASYYFALRDLVEAPFKRAGVNVMSGTNREVKMTNPDILEAKTTAAQERLTIEQHPPIPPRPSVQVYKDPVTGLVKAGSILLSGKSNPIHSAAGPSGTSANNPSEDSKGITAPTVGTEKVKRSRSDFVFVPSRPPACVM